MNDKTEKAYFAAGCFWGVEDRFKKTEGVIETTVGFMGGNVENPTYRQVCTDETGHAETVAVVFDPEAVSFKDLLEKFWEIHNPAQSGFKKSNLKSQYRSVVFYINEDQKKQAEKLKEKLEEKNKYKNGIATAIVPVDDFYKAEEYHQDYYEKNR